MRRIITTAGVLAVLAGGGAAYAATSQVNSYTASYSFSQKGTGTKKKPVEAGLKLTYTAKNNTSGDRAAPLKDIKVVLDGINTDANDFPTCTAAQIEAAKNDTGCNKGALIASGSVQSALGTGTTLAGAGTPCDPLLDEWNGGHNTIVFFFKTQPGNECAGLPTGATAPYTGTAVNKGANLDENIPLPPDVSTAVGGFANTYGSLEQETLTYRKASLKHKGKTYYMLESTGCKAGKHDTTTSFTAQTSTSGATQTETVTDDAKC